MTLKVRSSSAPSLGTYLGRGIGHSTRACEGSLRVRQSLYQFN
jgi:hypothetical protein